ncbi:MAG: MGMT family protein [Verrucomicrobiota bacterium]
MKTPAKNSLIEISIPTADGNYVAHYSEKGLAGLDWPTKKAARVVSSNPRAPLQILRWHRVTAEALKSVLAGRAAKNLPPLDWTGKTEFQQAVWREMLKIPAGKTRSYGEVAERIGRPKAVRAVGGACGANPIPVLVPCHRILAANQKIGGFSGGLDRKRSLLAREGIRF